MFTIDQIKAAHSKVKSGADFPAYIQAIKSLGISHYETFVRDGHTIYYGVDNFEALAGAKYPVLAISEISNSDQFKAAIKAHQQGKTDYPTFCNDCAVSGIVKWVVSIDRMTCTYYDFAGNEVLVESIPE